MDQPPSFSPHISSYRELRTEILGVEEGTQSYQPSSARDHAGLPNERLLHLLWQQQRFLRLPLTTLDRRVVTVYRPGRWSHGSGPDFLEAKLRFDDGPIRVGAVEVHVQGGDWMRHGHHRDPAYTSVLLHVIWRHEDAAGEAYNANGDPIPQLELSAFLNVSLDDLREALDEERWRGEESAGATPCQRSLQALTPETIGRLLDMAGEERWRQKASRFALKVERRGAEQALYEAVLEALGFKGNRMAFWQLARLAPIARLREVFADQQPTPVQIQAILFGVAGFLTDWQAHHQGASPESDAYLEMLLAFWEPICAQFPERLEKRHWCIAGIRPANFPSRRIAAAGYLLAGLAQCSLMDLWLAPLRALPADAPRYILRRCQRELVRTLQVTGEEDFWGHRYTFHGPRYSRRIDLLGAGRAATMVIDVLLPAAAALARLGLEPISFTAARAMVLAHPRLPSNEITREMMCQFFGADRARAAVVNSACRQQALMQLYRDFCLNEQETCQECAFPRLVARLEQLPRDAPPTGL